MELLVKSGHLIRPTEEATSTSGYVGTLDTEFMSALMSDVAALKTAMKFLEREKKFTSKDAVGRDIQVALSDPNDQDVTLWKDPPTPPDTTLEVTDAQLEDTNHRFQEDAHVNGPMFNVLAGFVLPGTLELTVSRSKLIDCAGREQRSDMTYYGGQVKEWPHVITMLDGKLVVGASVLGEGMRRAKALLSMQPYREFVVVPLYSRTEIVFLRVNKKLDISLTENMELLRFDAQNKLQSVEHGFKLLVHFLRNPRLMGYTACPVILHSLHGYDNKPFASAAICARSPHKAVFLVNDSIVVKAFRDRTLAAYEHSVLANLQQVPGIPRLLSEKAESCSVSEQLSGTDRADGAAVIMKPYCTVLTASGAQPAHFADFATTLEQASNRGYNNNDISGDNLVITPDGRGVIVDWGIATLVGTELQAGYGKELFVPLSCLNTQTGDAMPRKSSLLHDLESLYMVAVCCSRFDVPWARSKNEFRYVDRATACGYGHRIYSFNDKTKLSVGWEYLESVAKELNGMEGEPNVEKILAIFRSAGGK
jgi:hypothetical protein